MVQANKSVATTIFALASWVLATKSCNNQAVCSVPVIIGQCIEALTILPVAETKATGMYR